MVRGRVHLRHQKDMEVMFPHIEQNFYFISRQPRVLENTDGFLLPFSSLIWSIIIFSLLCLSVMFYITHSIYTFPELMYAGLHKKENNPTNFFLYTFCKITEPDPVPWSTERWSTGKFLAFVWSMYCLLIVSFYNCNLRAYLSAVDYEKPIDSTEDVVRNGQRPWLLTELTANQ